MTLEAEITASMTPRALSTPTAFQRAIHRTHWTVWTRVVTVLWDTFDRTLRKWASRLNSCCTTARVYIDPAGGTVRPWLNLCRSRLCPYCGRGRVHNVARQVHEKLRRMYRPKSLTLTARDQPGPMKARLKAFRKAFNKLRRTPLWKQHVKGGIYALETTRNPDSGNWHVHMHVIIDGGYLHWQKILAAWSQCIEGGEHIWIRQVSDLELASNHLAKYIVKPPDLDHWPDHAIVDYARSVHGERLIQTFGKTWGTKIDDKPEPTPDAPDAYSVSIPRIVKLARREIPEALDLAALIRRRWPAFDPFIRHELPRLRDLTTLEVQTPCIRSHSPPAEEVPKLEAQLFVAFTKFRAVDQAGGYPDSEVRWSNLPDPDEQDYA